MTGGQRGSRPRGAGRVALVGCGFVADLYTRSLAVHHVYSDKPLALPLAQARELHDLAGDKG